MNKQDIQAMDPGRELDCLIIQRVFGKELWDERHRRGGLVFR